MAIVKTVDIKINTNNGEQSLKSLRQELSRLKGEMTKFQEGSPEFNKLSKQAGTIQKQITGITRSIAASSATFKDMAYNAARVVSGISAGLSIATSIMGLFGSDTDKANNKLAEMSDWLLKLSAKLLLFVNGVKALAKLTKQLDAILNSTKNIDAAYNDLVTKTIEKIQKKYRNPLQARDAWLGEVSQKLQGEYLKSYEKTERDITRILELQARLRKDKREKAAKELNVVISKLYRQRMMIVQESIKSELSIWDKAWTYIKTGAATLFKAIGGFIKKYGGSLLIIGLLVASLKSIYEAFKAVIKVYQDNYSEAGKLEVQYRKLNTVITALNKSLELTKKLDSDITSGWKTSNAIQNQILALQNLNNEWKSYISNKRAAIQNDYENSQLETFITSGLEQALRTLEKLNISGITGINLEQIDGVWTATKESLNKLTAKSAEELKSLTQKELKDYSTYLIKETQTNLNKVAPVIEELQTKITTSQADVDSDKLSKKEKRLAEANIKNWQLRLDALNKYYDAAVKYQEQNLNLVQAEITRRTELNNIYKEDAQNRAKILNQEFENIKSQTKNADIRKSLIDEEIRQLELQQSFTKKGSAEWNAYDVQISKLKNTYSELIDEFNRSFDIQFRHSELWPVIESDIEETDEALETLLEDIYKFTEERFNVWKYLTGDTREFMQAMNDAITSGFGLSEFRQLLDVVYEMNNQFMILQDTMTRFSESSFGLGSTWNNVVSDMQKSFNQFALAVATEGEQSVLAYTNAVSGIAQTAGTFLNALAGEQDTQTKEGFENSKKLQISATVMNMLSGIMSAWTSAMNPANAWLTAPGQIAIGTTMSSMIAAIGAAQIAKIAKTKFGEGTSASSSAINSTIIPPVDYSSLVQGAQTQGQIRDTRVYVAETDIRRVTKKVDVQETEATY